jgi:mRNA interferase MazF
VIRRGEIWWANLDEPEGSEPGYRRPVLVLQRDEVNRSRIDTIVVCVLTGNLRLASAPGNTLLPRTLTGLRRDSVANASQVLTLDRVRLVELASALPRVLLREVDEGMRWFLGLDG